MKVWGEDGPRPSAGVTADAGAAVTGGALRAVRRARSVQAGRVAGAVDRAQKGQEL